MKIKLQKTEQGLYDELKIKLKQVRKAYDGFTFEDNDTSKLIQQLGDTAHQLHMALKERNHEPKHHAYMIKNRGLKPDHKEYYQHVHPVEDLLDFINDTNANDDPVDQTVGHEFNFTVFSRRWGHDDTYTLTRTETGWDVLHNHDGPCDKAGRPFLYSNFKNDRVYYPSDLKDYLEWLWMQAAEQGLSHEDVQEALEQLAKWVQETTKNAPAGGVWDRF